MTLYHNKLLRRLLGSLRRAFKYRDLNSNDRIRIAYQGGETAVVAQGRNVLKMTELPTFSLYKPYEFVQLFGGLLRFMD